MSTDSSHRNTENAILAPKAGKCTWLWLPLHGVISTVHNALIVAVLVATPIAASLSAAIRDAMSTPKQSVMAGRQTQNVDYTYPDSIATWTQRADSLNQLLENEWLLFVAAPHAAYDSIPSDTKLAHLYRIHELLNNKENMTFHDTLVSNSRPMKDQLESSWLVEHPELETDEEIEAAWLAYFREELVTRGVPRFPAFEAINIATLPSHLTGWVDSWSKERRAFYDRRDQLGLLGMIGPYQVLKDFVGTINNVLYFLPYDDSEVRALLQPLFKRILPELNIQYGDDLDKALDKTDRVNLMKTMKSVSDRWNLGYAIK